MKKHFLKVLCAILVALQLVVVMAISISASTPFGGTTTPSSMTVYQTDPAKMKVNGQNTIGEAWDLVEWSTTSYGYGGQHWVAANYCNFKFKALWAMDDQTAYLYILADVEDASAPSDTFGWATDCIKVYLDETGSVASGSKVTNYYGWYCRNQIPNGDYKKSIYKLVEKADNSGYLAEIKIPLTVAVEEGTTIKAQIQLQNGDETTNSAQKMWSASDAAWDTGKTAYDYVDHFGTLTFSTVQKVSASSDDSVEDANNTPVVFKAPNYVVKQTDSEAMKIDGKVSEYEAWNDAEWESLTDKFSFEPISKTGTYLEFATKFKAMWAKTSAKAYLYLLIDVTDKNMTSTKRAWAADNVRVFVDEAGTVADSIKAKLNRGEDYAASEFMSYVTDVNSSGFKYRVSQKDDETGYVLEVQYTFLNEDLAVKDATLKVNVAVNDADSTQDDGSHFAQQYAWSRNVSAWAQYQDITYRAHAGTFTLSDELLTKGTVTTPAQTTEAIPITESPATSETTPAANTSSEDAEEYSRGCNSAVVGLVTPGLAICGLFLCKSKKKKEN